MESKLKLLVKKIIKEEIQKLNEDTKINLTVQCVNPGIVQTTTGEAQSAEVKKNDIVYITRENQYHFFGKLSINKNMRFMHDPGLSGKDVDSNQVSNFEVAIKKDKIDSSNHNFWATFKKIK